MTKEIRTESGGLFGIDKQVIYEDGVRVGEVRHETEGFFSETPVDRTYDNDGKLVSEAHQEKDGTLLGSGAKKVVYERRSQKRDLTERVNNSSSSGYSDSGYHPSSLSSSSSGHSSPESSVNSAGCLIALLGGIALIATPLATIGLLISLAVQRAEQTFDYYMPRVVESIEGLFENDDNNNKLSQPVSDLRVGLVKQDSINQVLSKRLEQRLTTNELTALDLLLVKQDSENIQEPLKKKENKKSENVETKTYEPPIKRRETIKRPIETETPRKTSSLESKEERVRVYGAVLPSSEFSQSTPKDYAPVVVRVESADGNETIKAERRSKQDMEREISDDIGITYPVSGKRYAIERLKYPRFFDRLDFDRDGEVSLYELGEAQSTIFKITQKKKEGDLDAIVKEFLKKYKPKKNR